MTLRFKLHKTCYSSGYGSRISTCDVDHMVHVYTSEGLHQIELFAQAGDDQAGDDQACSASFHNATSSTTT